MDDETSILDLLGQHLEETGYTYDSCSSPLAAVEKLKKEPFSLLITDLKMPEMHGIEVVREAKLYQPDIAIVVVTALVDVTLAVEALRSGADDYVLKPFNLGEITVAVERSLERRRLILENRAYQEQLEERVKQATEGLAASNRQLLSTKEYLENLLNSSVDGVVTINDQDQISYANRGALQMFGYPENEMLGMNVKNLLVSGAEEFFHIRHMLRSQQALQNYETEVLHKSGMTIPLNVSLSQVADPINNTTSTFAICKDITQQKKLEDELKEMSVKDSLTGLYNQRSFYDRLESEIERARRQGHPLSLLLFDVDQFKTYNDCHGHLEGDKVLASCGQVVIDCTREHVDIGFRYGGDEFTVILPEADEQQALVIAERIRLTFELKRFDSLTLSVGLMEYRPGSSLRSFVRFADAKMYDAKRSGGNQVFVYRADSPEPEVQSQA
ncbi:MAG: diguanylate cyclase [Candidatus Hydrogenedentes bacterium]|nr:diguanylate cyclase [Candidatus Hydrogenedentota bacterium]